MVFTQSTSIFIYAVYIAHTHKQVPNTDNAELARLSDEVRADKSKFDSILRSHQRDAELLSSLKDRIHALENISSELRVAKEASELRMRMSEDSRGDAISQFKNELNELRHELAMEREARKQEAHRFLNELDSVRNESMEKARYTNDKYTHLEEELRREKEKSSLLEERLMSRVAVSEELLGKVSRGVNDTNINHRIEALEAGARKVCEGLNI
jgi:hypothetical protein